MKTIFYYHGNLKTISNKPAKIMFDLIKSKNEKFYFNETLELWQNKGFIKTTNNKIVSELQAVEMLSSVVFAGWDTIGPLYEETLKIWRERGFIKL